MRPRPIFHIQLSVLQQDDSHVIYIRAGGSSADQAIHQVLADNDAYHALEKVDGLIRTGPTGTNVNDVAVVLLKG